MSLLSEYRKNREILGPRNIQSITPIPERRRFYSTDRIGCKIRVLRESRSPDDLHAKCSLLLGRLDYHDLPRFPHVVLHPPGYLGRGGGLVSGHV